MPTLLSSFTSPFFQLQRGGRRTIAFCLALVTSLALAFPAEAAGKLETSQPRGPGSVPAGLEKSDWSSIRAAFEAGRHEIRATEGGHEARNPGLGWRTTWDGRGFLAQPASAGDGEWQWGLQLERYGFPGAEQLVSGTAPAHTEGQRLTYQWDANVQEWYVNDQRGVEHGFTVAARPLEKDQKDERDQKDSAATSLPSFESLLSFTMNVRGGLHPAISPDAQTVSFLDAAGAAVVTYGGLKVWDADGKILPSHFAAAEEDSFHLQVDERGAHYPITVDPVAQQAYLKASNPGGEDGFGRSVAISGDTVVVGAYHEDSNGSGPGDNSRTDAGAAYVFTRSGGTWTQQAYLKASIPGEYDGFGNSVAIWGDTLVVGACCEDGNGSGPGDNTMASAGAAYVFSRSGGTWTQQAYLKASNPGEYDFFGSSVAISGDTLVVGASWESSNGSGPGNNSMERAGAAYVFTRSGGTLTQQAYLKASNPGVGDYFGDSVAVWGDTVVVGAHGESSNGSGPGDDSMLYAGAAYVFTHSGGTWTQRAYLKASNPAERDNFGHSVAIWGDTAVVGAPFEDSGGLRAGAAYVFTRSGGTWTQQAYLKATISGSFNYFGYSLAIWVDTVVVGAFGEESNGSGPDDNSMLSAGAAYVFTRSGGTWTQQAYLKASNAGLYDEFGRSVAIWGDTVVVGAPWEPSNGSGPGDNSMRGAGAAYTLLFQPALPQITTQPVTAGSITATAATLNGRVFPNFSETAVSLEYGESPAGPLTTVTLPGTFSGGSPQIASRVLSGLLPGRTYRYRARATNGVGGAVLPAVAPFGFLTFTTAAAAPNVTMLAATSITSTSAVLNGTVRANGADASVYFRYFAPGTAVLNTAASPASVTGTATTPVSASVTGLLPGTLYTFTALASNSFGEGVWSNLTFTTLPDPLVGGLAEPLAVPVAGSLYGSLIQPDGRTILFGDFTSVYGTAQGRMARLLADGTLEGGLGFNPGANGPITCAALLADGKIMIGGDFTTLQPRGTGPVFTRNRLARLLSDGTVDTTFGDPGVTAFVLCMAVQPDGAVLVGGDFTSFQPGGTGPIITRNRIARITPEGALDTGFNPNASGPVYAISQQLDGKVLLGGGFTQVSGQQHFYLARVNGITGFAESGYAPNSDSNVFSIALQRDGRALVGGAFGTINGTGRSRLARLNTDGTLDLGFNPNLTGGNVFSLALQANQKLLIGGSFTAVGGTPRSKVARVDTAGVLDGFAPNVTGGEVRSIALQANGKVQLGGTFTGINGGAAPRTAYALLSNETAYQTLEKRSATEVYWSRGGSAPELLAVTFDQAAIIGTVFTPLGSGTRVDPATGDWHLSGISPTLPLSGQIRARGRTSSGYLNGATGIMESKITYANSLPVVSTVSATSITGTTVLLTGTVDTSSQLAMPAFKLDTTTAYTQPWRIPTPSSVTGTAAFTYQVTGLTPGTLYTFRATAENAGGRVDGTDKTFTTLSNLHVDYKADGSDNAPPVSSYTAWGRQVSFSLERPLAPGTTLMVVNNTGSAPIEGTFANLAQGRAVDLTYLGVTYPYVAHYYGGTGNDLVLLWRNTRALSWGWNNLNQLGIGDSTNQGIPGDVFPFDLLAGKTIVSLSGGFQHSVALCVDGTLATWGDNLEGQLGNGDILARYSSVPTAVEQGFLPAGIHPVAVSAGGSHTLALFSDGKVYAWGDNQYGQVGSDTAPVDQHWPVRAQGALTGKRVIGISAGENHSLAVCDDGFVAAWGRGGFGQLGNGNSANYPFPEPVDLTDVPVGEKIIAVAAGRWHSMALTSGGKVFTWGLNSQGQLGDGTVNDSKYPILIPSLTATAIYGGGTMHSLALNDSGKLVAWGSNTYGQLGTGAFANSYTPTVVNNAWLSGQSLGGVAAGDEHNMALRSDGTLYAWGLGNEGRLGNNNTGIHTQSVQAPVVATALDPGDRWLSFASGAASQHSLAIVAMSLQPAATTDTATPWSATEAYLYGIVRAHGVPVNVSFDYGLTSAYGTTVTASPATMNGTTPAYAEAGISGLLPGTTYHYQVKAAQGGSFIAFGGDRTFTTYSRLQMWRNDWFGSIENTGDAADSADPDNDGVSNLAEFALSLNPQQNSQGQLPEPQFFPGSVQYAFAEPDSYMGLTYGAEWSPDMTPGSWTAIPDLAVSPNHLFKLATPGHEHAFMRLKITAP